MLIIQTYRIYLECCYRGRHTNSILPVQRWGHGWSTLRLWGCNSGNCNKSGRNLRRASRRTTGRAGRGLPWNPPVHRASNRKPLRHFPARRTPPSHSCWSPCHSSKGKRPTRGPGGAWLSVPEDPTTACGARSGCWACPGRLLAISLSHVGLAAFLHHLAMKKRSIYLSEFLYSGNGYLKQAIVNNTSLIGAFIDIVFSNNPYIKYLWI